MALQYMDMLEKVGSSPATKFVLPMELTGMAQNLMAAMSGMASSGGNDANGKSVMEASDEGEAVEL